MSIWLEQEACRNDYYCFNNELLNGGFRLVKFLTHVLDVVDQISSFFRLA